MARRILISIGISMMLYRDDLLGIPIYALGQVFIIIAAGLTLWSMFDYLQAAWPLLRGGAPQRD